MSGNLTDGVWCDLMVCHVLSEKIIGSGVVAYRLAYKNAPNMSGAIKRATALNQMVGKIIVTATGRPDVQYVRGREKWFSV